MTRPRFRPSVSRRHFLASALTVLGAAPVFADDEHHSPPYLALKPFILPGKDEFPCEKAAMEVRTALHQAMVSLELPLAATVQGASPCPISFRQFSDDLQESVFQNSGETIGSGWKRWVQSLGQIRRAEFYPLPGDIIRYEVASQLDGRLFYRVGQWRQVWVEGRFTEFLPQEEHISSASRPLFRDVTTTIFNGVPSFANQLSRGVPYWRARLDPATGIDIYGSNGIAAGDLDGDGIDEIYVCQPGGLPNRLYKIHPDGSTSDLTEAWGAGLLDDTSMALFLDLRNSGKQDLVVLRSGGPVLLLNEGDRFSLRDDAFHFVKLPAGGFTGMAAADFDRDGKLDLYLCCYVYFQSEAQYTYASPYDDARNGPPNFLFRNKLNPDGTGFFEDCTAETGMNENNDRFSFAPAWCDYNDDGWPDLYVANDFGRKNLYRNTQGKFQDVAASAGVEDIGPGMSASWFDYDHDGRPDLYVANMWSDAGQRVVREKSFAPATGEVQQEHYRRHTKGNSLYHNLGNGRFEETTFPQHAEFGRWAWAAGGHDLDNDGEAEIFVTCGMLTNSSTTDLMSFFWRDVVARSPVAAAPSAAYENGWNALNQFIREDYSWSGREPNVLHKRRGERYFDYSGVSGLDAADNSRAFALTDIDGDGRPDLILKSRLGPQVRVFQNDCAHENQSVAFRLKGTKSNRDAIGAKIQVDSQTKWLEAGSGFLSQHGKTMLFGLGESKHVTRVRITWPSGAVQEWSGLQTGRVYTAVEGSADLSSEAFRKPKRLPAEPVPSDNRLALHDTWFLEPIPLPSRQNGPGLLLITDGEPASAGNTIDLSKGPPELRRKYEIFRRYLFDWRTGLATPFALLLNNDGDAVKVYGGRPSAEEVKQDLAELANFTRGKALPFPGFYVHQPRRDYFKLGAAFLWSGYLDEALPYLERVLRQTPENPRVLLLTGQIHLQRGRIDLAQKSLQEALRVTPQNAEALSGMGSVLEAQNDLRGALEYYEKALSLKPDLVYTLMNAASAADQANDFQRAESWYRRALALDPSSADATNGLGLMLAKQDHPEEARTYFEQAIAKKHDHSGAINNLGVLYLGQGKVQDAIAAFQYGIKQVPDDDILYLNLGRTYARLGQIDKAREVMQQLLERKPGDTTARRAIQELDRH